MLGKRKPPLAEDGAGQAETALFYPARAPCPAFPWKEYRKVVKLGDGLERVKLLKFREKAETKYHPLLPFRVAPGRGASK